MTSGDLLHFTIIFPVSISQIHVAKRCGGISGVETDLFVLYNYIYRIKKKDYISITIKIMVTTRGAEWRQQNVETAPFYTNKEVDHLIKETEV